MNIDIVAPSVGESISQVELARWLVADGAWIEKDQEIAEIDSDKATLSITATHAGVIKITTDEGTTLEPGKTIGYIDTTAARPETLPQTESTKPASEALQSSASKPIATTAPTLDNAAKNEAGNIPGVIISPQARRLLDQQDINLPDKALHKDNRRITTKDILSAIAAQVSQPDTAPATTSSGIEGMAPIQRNENRQKMSALRRKLAERLVAVKNQTAMLTSFQEVDMSAVLEIRKKHNQAFLDKYGVKPGLMSFFTKAVTIAVQDFPQVNGRIDGDYIVLHDFVDVGIAVSTAKGLVVPVVRNAQSLSIAQLELKIAELAQKARSNKISIEELTGGTISITNGGVFGSLLSTPLINPPQSAILGMHNITDRPVAIGGKVEIRPMMYLALSYDHRIIDGRESVGFLIKIKDLIENPQKLLTGGIDPIQKLLGL